MFTLSAVQELAPRQHNQSPSSEKIAFTRAGWRQFRKVNSIPGIRLMAAFLLKMELAEYIVAHEASGHHLDTLCQEVRFDDGIYLLLKKVKGVWYITDVVTADEPAAYSPLFVWQRIKAGIDYIIARVFCGWCGLPARKAAVI